MPWSKVVKKSKKKGDWSAPKGVTCEPKTLTLSSSEPTEGILFVGGPWDRQRRNVPGPTRDTVLVPVMEGLDLRVRIATYNVRRQGDMETFAYYVGTR